MKNKLTWLEAALLLAPFLALAALWNKLPARLPMHWNFRGEIDRWSANRIEILILPLIAVGVIALLHLLPWLDPKLRRTLQENDRMRVILQILRLAFAVFFDALFSVQLASACGYTIASGRIVVACTLVLLAILGNYSGNLRPNYFLGIRTPWTLESAATWRATHRLGGRLIFFGALLLLVLQFLLNENAFGILLAGLVIALVIWAFLYSWHHFRTHEAMPES